MPRSDLGLQMTLWKLPPSEHVINVASVPQRSPFRYPGGKTWLIPKVRSWLHNQSNKPKLLIEPFAGGAIVGLTAAFEDLVDHVILVELDKQVAAVWETIFGGGADWLADRISSFNLTLDNARNVLTTKSSDVHEQAFQTILKNRTFHGGILAPGATFIKHGENGKGLQSRWYAQTLAKRITAIGKIRNRFTFIRGDGITVMKEHAQQNRAAYFIDPPYTAGGASGKRAGTRLYNHHELDHEQLFDTAAHMAGDILLTYDDTQDVRKLAARYSFVTECVAMKNTHHAKMTELLIGRNLSWLHT